MPIFTKYTKPQVRCLFIHIPKTGGTSLENALHRLGWLEQLKSPAPIREEGPLDSVKHFKISPQHYHALLLDQIIRWEAIDLCFTVCRHPFHRLKSEYYWQRELGIAPAGQPEEWLTRVMEQFSNEPSVFDNHLRPQVEFIPPDQSCKVFRLEDDGVKRALAWVDASAPASRLRTWTLAAFPAWRHKSAPAKEVEVAFAGLRQEIETFYSRDMAYFGY